MEWPNITLDSVKSVLSKTHARAVLILVFALLIFLLLINFNKSPDPNGTLEQIWLVDVITAQAGSHTPNVVLYGKVESPRAANILAAVQADVIATPAKDGQFVKKDDLLVELDHRDTELLLKQRAAEVTEFEAKIMAEKNRHDADLKSLEHEKELLEIHKRHVDRQRELIKEQVGSEAAHDQSQQELYKQHLAVTTRELSVKDHESRLNQLTSQLERSKALASQAQLDLDRTSIRAPFAGRVADLVVAVGDRVQVGQSIVEVYDTSHLEIRAQIPSQYLDAVKQSVHQSKMLPARANIDGVWVDLALERLSGEVESGRGGVDGIFKVKTANSQLALGRVVELELDLPAQRGVYLIPIQALHDNKRIYIVKDGRMQTVNVTILGSTSLDDGSQAMLVNSTDLKSGQQIITTHLPNARNGLKIKVNLLKQNK